MSNEDHPPVLSVPAAAPAPPGSPAPRPSFGRLAFLGLGRNLGLIAVSAFFFNLAFSMQTGIFTNFIVEDLHILPAQVGLLESVREFPGLFTVLLAAATFMFAQSTLGGLCLIVTGIGFALQGQAGGFWPLVWVTLLMSSGMHLFFPAHSTLILHHSPPGRKAASLGAVNSVFAAASLVGLAAVFFLARFVSFRTVFTLCGILIMGGAVALFMLPREKGVGRRRSLVLRRRYGVYYLLNMLSGGRRHVYLTFARFALVQLFGLPVTTMVALQGAGSAMQVLTRPMMGRIIDRFGERRVLMINYSVLAVLYLGYAFLHYLPLVCVIFILDQLMVDFDMAQTTYLDKIAPPEDLAPTLSAGGTFNHITAVAVPFLGGLVWQAAGSAVTFCGGSVLALMSVAAASRIRVGERPSR
jgi:predicted MFS family arabinose efflux permease